MSIESSCICPQVSLLPFAVKSLQFYVGVGCQNYEPGRGRGTQCSLWGDSVGWFNSFFLSPKKTNVAQQSSFNQVGRSALGIFNLLGSCLPSGPDSNFFSRWSLFTVVGGDEGPKVVRESVFS